MTKTGRIKKAYRKALNWHAETKSGKDGAYCKSKSSAFDDITRGLGAKALKRYTRILGAK